MADFPSPSSAYGRWNLMDVRDAVMGGNWPVSVVADPYFPYVTMLLPGNGTNGAQNNTFLDGSTNNFTITRNGNTTQGTFSPYGSNWSNYFNGTGNYLTTATSASGFSFGTGDFTVEFWINSNQTTRCDPVGQDTSYSASGWWGFVFNRSSNNEMEWFENTNPRISATSVTWNNGQWNHVAVTRSGSSVKMFLNGTQVGSTYTTSFTYGASSVGVIAGVLSDDKTSGPLTGYLSNVRIVKGTALYTGTFTPSTTPLTAVSGTNLLTCQANRFFDASTNALAITITGTPSVQRFSPFSPTAAYSTSVIGGSGYFDGTGDYLSVATNTAFSFGTGDFTISTWIYTGDDSLTPGGYSRTLFTIGNIFGYLRIAAYHGGTTGAFRAVVAGTNICDGSTVKLSNSAWHNITITRQSGNVRHWIDGVFVGTVAYSTSITNTITNGLGADMNGPDGFWNGYISATYVNKGTALFTGTSNISVPTTPPTSSDGNSLLANYTNGAIIDNAMMNDLETVGNAQISTSVKKYGTGSIAFDGTGDYLTGPITPITSLGSGAYTVEFWLYKDSTGTGERGILQTQTASLYGLSIFADGTTIYIDERKNAFDGSDPRISGTISQDTWIYITVCRQTGTSGTLRAFVNGTQIGSSVTSNLRNLTSTGPIYVGNTAVATNPLKGYIDDLRITKGIARYTTTFTPPTQALSTF